MVRPSAQRHCEWASASRTSSSIANFFAVVGVRLLRCLSSFYVPVHACPASSCLPADIQIILSSNKHDQTTTVSWRWRPTLRRQFSVSPGQLVSWYSHALLPVVRGMAISPIQLTCSGKVSMLWAAPVSMGIALGKKSLSTSIYGETSTAPGPEQQRLGAILVLIVFFPETLECRGL